MYADELVLTAETKDKVIKMFKTAKKNGDERLKTNCEQKESLQQLEKGKEGTVWTMSLWILWMRCGS